MPVIDRVEAFAVSIDHHYKVAGVAHRPGALPGTPYYLEPAWAQVYSTRTMTCLLRVTDSDGAVGWGESQAPVAPGVVVAVVEELLGPALLGREVEDPAAERDRLAGLMAVRGHHAGFFADAVAGPRPGAVGPDGAARRRPAGRGPGRRAGADAPALRLRAAPADPGRARGARAGARPRRVPRLQDVPVRAGRRTWPTTCAPCGTASAPTRR